MTKPNPETPAERKARRRATERRCKPRDRIVSLESCQDYTKAQERVKIWGYKSKLVCPSKPDRHLLPFVHPEIRAHRLNGYNIARIHGIADIAVGLGCAGFRYFVGPPARHIQPASPVPGTRYWQRLPSRIGSRGHRSTRQSDV